MSGFNPNRSYIKKQPDIREFLQPVDPDSKPKNPSPFVTSVADVVNMRVSSSGEKSPNMRFGTNHMSSTNPRTMPSTFSKANGGSKFDVFKTRSNISNKYSGANLHERLRRGVDEEVKKTGIANYLSEGDRNAMAYRKLQGGSYVEDLKETAHTIKIIQEVEKLKKTDPKWMAKAKSPNYAEKNDPASKKNANLYSQKSLEVTEEENAKRQQDAIKALAKKKEQTLKDDIIKEQTRLYEEAQAETEKKRKGDIKSQVKSKDLDLAKYREEMAAVIENTSNMRQDSDLVIEVQREIERKERYVNRFEYDELIAFITSLDFEEDLNKPTNSKSLHTIPDKFGTYEKYKRIMEELFFEEVRAQVVQNIRMSAKEHTIAYAKFHMTGITEHDLMVLGFLCELTVNKEELDPRFNSAVGPYRERLRRNDLVLVSKRPVLSYKELAPHEFCLGVLCSEQAEPGVEKKSFNLHIRTSMHAQERLFDGRNDPQHLWVLKLEKCSTFIREYQALKLIEFCRLFNEIMDPTIMKGQKSPQPLILDQDFIRRMRRKVNDSQYETIGNICNPPHRISLIQGPPGTGKTFTIVSIVSTLLASKPKPKIMICTPSNAAVDEIVLRLVTKGIMQTDGSPRIPSVLRVGVFDRESKEPPPEVKKVSLEAKLEQMFKSHDQQSAEFQILQFKKDLDKLERKIVQLKNQKWTEENQKQINRTIGEKDNIRLRLGALRTEKLQKADRKKDFTMTLLNTAEVLCCTLSTSGSEKFKELDSGIDVVIIDEACQATELSSLIPLQHDVDRLIMVGDPMQLPATTFSNQAVSTKYNRSLLQRIMENGIGVSMLKVQYRMDPVIRTFPSREFYKGQLLDADSIAERAKPKPLESMKDLAFLDFADGGEERAPKTRSIRNPTEANAIFSLFQMMDKKTNQAVRGTVGVITPYQAQVQYIKELFRNYYGSELSKIIEVSTVDGFQGREKDIIIFSCVRASKMESIGFLADERRMNVAITRPKHVLWVVGNTKTLTKNHRWGGLVQHCIQNSSYLRVSGDENLPLEALINPEVWTNLYRSIFNQNNMDTVLQQCQATIKSYQMRQAKPRQVVRVSPDPEDSSARKSRNTSPRHGGRNERYYNDSRRRTHGHDRDYDRAAAKKRKEDQSLLMELSNPSRSVKVSKRSPSIEITGSHQRGGSSCSTTGSSGKLISSGEDKNQRLTGSKRTESSKSHGSGMGPQESILVSDSSPLHSDRSKSGETRRKKLKKETAGSFEKKKRDEDQQKKKKEAEQGVFNYEVLGKNKKKAPKKDDGLGGLRSLLG
mmetsp:Transcript_22878/g.25839  ORF Transcript_22878/g.25839 Transcript_22878/m.25839 type:complete len:1296 (+) Transcript_22878:27-3914(+)